MSSLKFCCGTNEGNQSFVKVEVNARDVALEPENNEVISLVVYPR